MPRLRSVERLFSGSLVSSLGSEIGKRTDAFRRLDNSVTSLTHEGAVEAVPGFQSFAIADEDVIRMAATQSQDGTRILIIATETKLYDVSLDAADFGALTEIKSGLSTDRASFTTFEDLLLFFNGNDAPQAIPIADPTMIRDIGLEIPDATGITTVLEPDLTNPDNNSLIGVVRYWIAEFDPATNVEGATSLSFPAGPPDGIDCGDGNRVRITFPDDARYNDKTFRIYRSDADGFDKNYLRQETVPASGGLTFIDGKRDSLLGRLPEVNGEQPPAEITSVVNHFEHVFGLANSTLYWSDLARAESWYHSELTGNFLQVFGSDGDVGVVLARDVDGILFFKRNHLYKINGRIPSDFFVSEVTLSDERGRNIGTPTNKSLHAIPGGIVFYWKRGVYAYRNGSVRYISADIRQDLETPILDRNERLVSVGWDPIRRWVKVSLPLTADRVTHTYLWSPDREQWVGRMTEGFGDFEVAETSDDAFEVLAVGGGGPTPRSVVYRLLTGFDFAGREIAIDVERYPYRPGPTFHRFDSVDVLFDPFEGQSTTASVALDGSNPAVGTIDMSSVAGESGAAQHTVSLGRMAHTATLRLQATTSSGVDNVIGNEDELIGIDEGGQTFEVISFDGGVSGWRVNGAIWHLYATRPVRR